MDYFSPKGVWKCAQTLSWVEVVKSSIEALHYCKMILKSFKKSELSPIYDIIRDKKILYFSWVFHISRSQSKLKLMRKLRNKIVKVYARSEIQTPSRSPFHLFNYLFRYTDLRKILIPSFHSQIVNFTTPKTSTPTVIVSASYLNPVPQHNSIATWVEVCDYDNFYYLRKLSLHIRTTYTNFSEILVSCVLWSTIVIT